MKTEYNKIKNLVLIISLIVFFISLTQTAFTYNEFDRQKTHSAFSLLIMGGFAILGGGLMEWFIWIANPLYLSAIIFLFKSNKTSKNLSLSATIIALSFITWNKILAAENGRTAPIDSLNTGYWLWLLSLMILTIGTIYYFRKLDKNNDSGKETTE